MRNEKHFPVLLTEVLHYLDPKVGESFLDLTAGYGGHSSAVLERTFKKGTLLKNQSAKASLVDRDQNAIAHLDKQFKGQGVQLIHKDYLAAAKELCQKGERFDMILADLGVSSPHLDTASRGFSIRLDGPLDMRMDERQSLTAGTIVNSYPVEELREIIRKYGEEPRANKIARMIVEHRPINSTHELAALVARVTRPAKPVSRGA